MDMHTVPVNDFMKQLSSKAPVPGGGGASALMVRLVSLCAPWSRT